MDPETGRQKRRKIRRRSVIVAAIILVLALIFSYISIRFSGTMLIEDEPFTHVKWAVILEGQTPDLERNDYAVKLLMENKADTIILMGRRVFRNRNNVDFYLDDMLKQGDIDIRRIYLFRHDDNSSLEEAYSIIPALKLKGVDTVLLVTRGASTKRVSAIFNKLAGGKPVFITTDLEDATFNPRTWIHTREARKIWFKEWASFLVSKVELLFANPANPVPGKVYPLEWAGAHKSGKSDEGMTPIDAVVAPIVSDTIVDTTVVELSSSSKAVSSSSKAEVKKVVIKKPAAKPALKAAPNPAPNPEKKVEKKVDKSDKKSDKKAEKSTDKNADKHAKKKDAHASGEN